MRRIVLFVILLLGAFGAAAQSELPQPGDPPVLEHITVSPPSEDGSVTINGSAGAVFSNAYVIIRNLYTGTTAYERASITGSFSAQLDGLENTPYWISVSQEQITASAQNQPGSLPGGPGAILYAPFSEPPPPTQAITQLAIDGNPSDWSAYPDAVHFSSEERAIDALRNAASLYVLLSGTYVSRIYTQLEVRFTIDTNSYTIMLNPREMQPAALARVNPTARDLGTLNVAARRASAVELRIPLSFLTRADRLTLDRVRAFDTTGAEILSDTIGLEIPPRDESDGIYRAQNTLGKSATPFSIAGTLRQSSGSWSARGRAESLALTPGDRWQVEMNVNYGESAVPDDARMIGAIAFQPIVREVNDEMRVVGDAASNNGWSNILTPSGLPIDNLSSSVELGEATAAPYQLIRDSDAVQFPLDFSVTVPDDLPPGLYVPVFSGFTRFSDGTRGAWDNALTRLPLVVSVGGVDHARLLWTLFADHPSDGSRGTLADEDRNFAALSNRVRFNSATYILPPFNPGTRTPVGYPLEPYLLNELPNRYADTSEPLIPFRFPGGRLSASVTRPDGSVDNLGSADIDQNQLSTTAADERALFGEQSPVDEFRLTTLNPQFSAYHFDQYGEYTVTVTGSLSDVWGNTYDGGGTYRILAAELLDLTPGVLPGTPFEVGNAFNFGLHLSPGYPAEITIQLRVYPLDGSTPSERTVTGTANANGYFQPNTVPFVFSAPGEYVVDYEARFTAPDGRLWAASLRGAGVIAGLNSALVAHGERGVPGVVSPIRPAWFDEREIAEIGAAATPLTQLFFPYYSGDVAWIPDGRADGITPQLTVQDLGGAYEQQLVAAIPDYRSDAGLSIYQLVGQDELPVYSAGAAMTDYMSSYRYVSAVRPNVSVRQFVVGSDSGTLALDWDNDDPLNRQIGAGMSGNRPGDFIFLFGGAVVRAGEVRDSAIYGALAVVTDDEPARIYPPDRGAAGSADGGALLTINDQAVDAFFVPTGVQPGEVLHLGDTIAISGQVAPTLPARVTTTLTAPSGRAYHFSGRANAIGYYYSPASRLMVDEPGLWTVSISVVLEGTTSAGQVEPPVPEGSVLGAQDQQFSIYVLPDDAEPLPWNPLLNDTIIPIVSPYNFSFILPEDWSQIRAYYTLTTPGYIIEDGALDLNGRNFTYQYTAPLQSRVFPNLEDDGRSGIYIADVRTLTFVATGVDASGTFQMRSRTFTLMHDRLMTTE